MMHKPLFTGILLFAFLCLVGGCGESEIEQPAKAVPLKTTSSTVKKQAPVQVRQPETEKASPVFVYDPAGKRDPFEALFAVRKPIADNEGPETPLQKHDLGQFRIAGIIIGKNEPLAMVMAPGGKSYILKKGVKIGRNSGRVIAIQADGVLVEERFYDFSGDYRKSIQKIQLPEREGV